MAQAPGRQATHLPSTSYTRCLALGGSLRSGLQRCASKAQLKQGSASTLAALSSATVQLAGAEGQTSSALRISDSAQAQLETITTIFRWPAALPAQSVSVTGSYCGWQVPTSLTRSAETQDFVCSLPLPPGLHEFKYRVDGEWATSPCEPVTIDAKGRRNHHRVIAASVEFAWSAGWGGREVFVTGAFAGWSELIPLRYDAQRYRFHVACSLPPGSYAYQYLVDGRWLTSPDAPVMPDDQGHLCNKMVAKAPPAFQIFYATGWQKPVLHYRTLQDGTASHEGWQQEVMCQTASRSQSAGGAWTTAIVPVPPGEAPACCKLEFHISGGSDSATDRPSNGASYTCHVAGGFKLQRGCMLPFPRAQAAPIMVVSDLDGTMVGENEEADAATAQFCEYWENTAVLAGGVLVYNTGRSLGQFQELLDTKAPALALPNALITAVGTKIFLLRSRDELHAQAVDHEWVEDREFAERLSHHWDLEIVREVANDVIQACGGDGNAHWLDNGSEHPHRIALSMKSECVPQAKASLIRGCHSQGLQVQVIVSGMGDWRYVDCVSNQGGKLNALEYVRSLFSIPRSHCVSAGDSGNDILMLQGTNPGILVGNSQPELLQWLTTQPQDGRLQLTDAHYAYGILEGLARHGLR